ncbi:MAG: AarF/UbiB family protein [Acidobacteriota bacterium]
MLIRPKVLSRLKEIATIFVDYGLEDLVERSGVYRHVARISQRAANVLVPATAPTPARLRAALERLGPTFIKLGQTLSTHPGLLPLHYVEEMQKLQDQVQPFEFERVREIVRLELGMELSEIFYDFNVEPLAAGSIAQVHQAKLKDGSEVAVKVQRPEIERTIEIDLEILHDIARFLDTHSGLGAKFDFPTLAAELEQTISRELNFRQEARHANMIRNTIAEFTLLKIPTIYDELVTKRVLVSEFLVGRQLNRLRDESKPENHHALAIEMLRGYLKQVCMEGFFHCDPHPGNVLLLADGRLGLLDFGQMATLDSRLKDNLLLFLLYIAQNRGDRVADICLEIGLKQEHMQEARLRREVSALVARYHNVPLDELQPGRTIFQLVETCTTYGLKVPGEVALLGKTLVNLDGVGRILDPEFNPFEVIQDYAEKIMRNQLRSDLNVATIYSSTLDVKRLLSDLPHQIRQILDRLSTDRVRIDVHMESAEQMITAIRTIANRIALSLIVAALIIGSSNLVSIDAGPQIGGYPLFALLGFLAAAGLGIFLIFSILFGRIRKD